MWNKPIEGVLFDLDGTLLDTAPDLAWALNQVLKEQNVSPLSLEEIQPHVTHGSQALISLGFPDLDTDTKETLRLDLIQHYTANISRLTTLFPGMDALLNLIENRSIPWGIVTNKPSWLTTPLVTDLGLSNRAKSIISGDTTTRNKPFPDPLLLAAKQMGVAPTDCLYIGDAQRDIEAGLSAGMLTAVALFGYIDKQDNPRDWNAHIMFETPEALTRWTQERLQQ